MSHLQYFLGSYNPIHKKQALKEMDRWGFGLKISEEELGKFCNHQCNSKRHLSLSLYEAFQLKFFNVSDLFFFFSEEL